MPSAGRTRTFVMFPPANSLSHTTQRGQLLDSTGVGYVLAITQDADALQQAGWTRAIEIGTTANRPFPGQTTDNPGQIITLPASYAYYDTTVGAVVFWNFAKQAYVTVTNTLI